MFVGYQIVFAQISLVINLLFLHQIDGRNCNFNVQVEQRLLNEGFHRNFSINIDFASDNEEERWLYEDCMVGVEQTLPAGVYSSMDDINDSGCTSLIHTIFKSPVNIELPAEWSEPIVIHLLSKVREYRTHIYIPVHARYHRPVAGGGTFRNEIPVPKLYLLCPNSRLDQCDDLYTELSNAHNFCADHVSKKACKWKEIPMIMVTAPVTWEVPVGDLDHLNTVAYGTAVVVIVGSLYLLNTVHRYRTQTDKNNKKNL